MKGIPLDPGNAEPIRIAVRIPAGMKERFEDYCRQRGVTMSDVVRDMIEVRLTVMQMAGEAGFEPAA